MRMKGSWSGSLGLLLTLLLFLTVSSTSARQRHVGLETHVKGKPLSQTLSRAGRAQAEGRKEWMQARQDRRLWQLFEGRRFELP